MNQVYYKSKGQLYLRRIGGDTGLIPLGNSSSIAISLGLENQEVKDYTTAGGGIAASDTSVSSVTASVATYNFNAHNLALAVAGTYTAVAGGVVAAEAHTVISQGSLLPLNKLRDTTVPVTVTGTGGTPAYVDGTDYEMRETGIYIVEGGNIAAAASIEVNYTAADAHDIEALVATGYEYELVFDGVNTGEAGGKRQRVTGYRVKVSPSSDLPLISDDYSTLNLNIAFLENSAIVGTGLSKYLQIKTTV